MAFPSNPSVGDTFTLGGKVYRWNGTSWARTAQSVTGQLSSATIADNSIPASKLEGNVLTPYALDTDLTTANVIETGNLYFTNARTVSALTSGYGIEIASNGRITALPVVSGSVTTVNGETGAVTLVTANINENTNLYFTNARVYANVALGFPTNTYVETRLSSKANIGDLATGNVPESGGRLYFTTERAIAALSAGNGIILYANGMIQADIGALGGGTITLVAGVGSGAVSNVQLANGIVSSGILTTGNVIESGNLYYTNARVAANVATLGYASNSYVNTRLLTKANVSDLTSANISEVTNLYYTNARVAANVATLGYATNSYVNTRLLTKANVADLTTSNVTEGSNQYYTNTRVQAYLGNISGNLIPSVNEIYNLGSSTRRFKDLYLSGNTISLGETLLSADPATGGFTISSTNVERTGSITFSVEANAALVSEIVTTNVITVDSITSNSWNGIYTSNVAESASNLYFTNARTRAALSSGTGVNFNSSTGSISISQNVDISSNVTFQNLLVTGNLTVTGNTVSLGVTSLAIEDNMIYLNANSEVTNPDLGFAGNYNDGSYHHAGIFRDATDGVWKFFENYAPEPDASPYIDTSHASFRLANVAVRDITGNVVGKVSSLDNFTTSNLSEGTNLYFTNTRAISSLTAGSGVSIAANGRITATETFTGTVTSVLGQTTTLSNAQLACATISSGVLNTSNVSEGSNLYFTNTRAISSLTAGSGISIAANGLVTGTVSGGVTSVGGSTGVISNAQLACSIVTTGLLNTSNVTEGSNLYFTNTRAIGSLTSGSGISIAANGRITSTAVGGVSSVNGQTGAVSLFTSSNTVPAANILGAFWYKPEGGNLYVYVNDGSSNVWVELDTPFFAGGSGSGTVTNVFGQTNTISNAQLACAVISSGVLNTSNISEGSNLYFTNARVYSNISPLLNTNTITEGSNLYFTNVRVGNYLSGSLQTNIIPSSNSTFTLGNVNNRFNELYLSGNTSFTASNSFISNPTLAGTTYSQQFVEVLNTKTFATGNVTHDFNTGAIFYHSNINTNFTANFTNVPVIENRTISLALVLNQHATSYIANAIQINGTNQTIKWVNGIVPSGSASNVNVQNFTLVRANTSWIVLGSLSAFI